MSTLNSDDSRNLTGQIEALKCALRESQEKQSDFIALLKAIPESAFLIDAEGIVIICNAITAKRLGLDPNALVGQSIFDFLPPDVAEARRRQVSEVVRTGTSLYFKDIRNGRFFEHFLCPVQNADGQVARIAILGRDITGDVQSQEKLKLQNELLTAIREAQNLFISGQDTRLVYQKLLDILVTATCSEYGFLDEVLHDPDGTPYKLSLAMSNISWDETSRRLYEQLVERKLEFRNLNNLSGAPVLERRIAIANDAPHDVRYHGIPPGHPPLNRFMGIPLFWGKTVIGVAGVANCPDGYSEEVAEFIKPLTQTCAAMIWAGRIARSHRENLDALKASEDKFHSLFENIAAGCCIDELIYENGRPVDYRILAVNAEYEKIMGIPRNRAEGCLGSQVYGAGLPPFFDTLCQVVETGVPAKLECFFEPVGKYLEITVSRPGKGLFSTIFLDITERKHLEGQLQQARKMESVGRLAGGVAHDFNNMLSVIMGHTEMALASLPPEEPLYDDFQEIQKAAQRSAQLTRQLLAFARKQVIVPRVLDLNETLESMLKMLRRLVGEHIDLVWQPDGDLWPVKMDPSQIDQVLANLCVNARDAIAEKGSICIETHNCSFNEPYCPDHAGFPPGDYVLLSVSDTGCGMDTETLKNMFEPFFTTKGLGKGTGMGLPMVYGIVKQNRGEIEVYSELGHGTTVRIYLPRDKQMPDQAHAEKTPEPVPRGTGTILLVEDEPAILNSTAKILKHLGYTVLTAASPGEALQVSAARAEKIDLLITDVIMPGMNGRELSAKMLAAYPDLKCMYMSGYTANEIAHRGILAEDMVFIQKPFSIRDLGDKIQEAMGK